MNEAQIDKAKKYIEVTFKPEICATQKWSGREPIPEMGARVFVKINGWKWSTVVGYFVECGWIGLLVKPEVRPAWAIEQRKGLNHVHVFGAEIATADEIKSLKGGK